jgi:hypothetical protein
LGENIVVRKFTRLAVLPLVLLVLAGFAGANGQLPGKDDDVSPSKLPTFENGPRALQVPAPTVDELVSKLEALRKQKAEIEKQEKLVTEELQARFKALQERLSKLGVLPARPPIADAPLELSPGSVPPKVAK